MALLILAVFVEQQLAKPLGLLKTGACGRAGGPPNSGHELLSRPQLNSSYAGFAKEYNEGTMINRPGVAGAVLQTAS